MEPRIGIGRSLVAWAPALGWAGLIFFLSAQPDLRFAPEPGLDFAVREAGHMAIFGILALLVAHALRRGGAEAGIGRLAFLITLAYAISDELHQATVAGRTGSVLDVGWDALGAAIALAFAPRLGRSLGRRRESRGSDATSARVPG